VKEKVLYLCDGRKDCEKEPWECYTNGGWCYHTNDITHAKNFYKRFDGHMVENETNETVLKMIRKHVNDL
jgi:hypothetical protein